MFQIAGALALLSLGALAVVATMPDDEAAETLRPAVSALASTAPRPEPAARPDAKPAVPAEPVRRGPVPTMAREFQAAGQLESKPVKPTLDPALQPEPTLRPAPIPPARGSGREAWLSYADRLEERRTARFARAQHIAEQRAVHAAAPPGDTPISDEFGRTAGAASYPDEAATELGFRLNAVVDPVGREPFAIIEDQGTGLVASYREGTMLPPGVLPGVWVVDVEPGVVHLLDLQEDNFEYLTFEKAQKKLSPAGQRAQRRRERAKERAAKRKKRRAKSK